MKYTKNRSALSRISTRSVRAFSASADIAAGSESIAARYRGALRSHVAPIVTTKYAIKYAVYDARILFAASIITASDKSCAKRFGSHNPQKSAGLFAAADTAFSVWYAAVPKNQPSR